MTAQTDWQPPSAVSLEEVVKLDREVAALPNIAIDEREDIFRIRELEMDWDIGVMIYAPRDSARIPSGADGRTVSSLEEISGSLSLVFGGLLWPIAWIWAYTKPVMHKLAYGTDRASHEEEAEGDAWDEKKALHEATPGLHDRLARLVQRGIPASEMKALRADLEALEAKYAQEAR